MRTNTLPRWHLVILARRKTLLYHPQQNGPAFRCMEAGVMASFRCDLAGHGTAGSFWPTAAPGPSHSCASRSGFCRPTLFVWEVENTFSLCSVQIWILYLSQDQRLFFLWFEHLLYPLEILCTHSTHCFFHFITTSHATLMYPSPTVLRFTGLQMIHYLHVA